jgi:hypothetical protein
MFAFIVLLFIALTIFLWSSQEGFQTHALTMPKVPGRLSALPEKEASSVVSSAPGADTAPAPANPPGTLPIAPYEELATMSPLPYQDTTQVKANRQQLVNLVEMLKGFLAYEAQEISESSDPAIQLPLQTARSDFHTLQAEVSVLNRNPGIQPTMTLTHLNDVSSNLAFLQSKVRLMGHAGALQGPIYEFKESDSASASAQPTMEGFQAPPPAGARATVADLKDLSAKIQGEILRLSASGTTDPVVQARVAALTSLRQDLNGLIRQVDSGALLPTEIPVMKADIDRAFPVLGKPSEPLPQLIQKAGLPAGLGNLLPSNLQKDPATMRQISQLVDKYADSIVNGITATFSVQYKPTTKEKARKATSTLEKTGFPSLSDLDNVSQAKFLPMESDCPVTDHLAPLPQDAGRGPARFDWKERARQIEDQIRKRGLVQKDFGVMPRDTKVSSEFSWKGYSKMMCTRLQATMDPGLPELCGCPPMDWKGWRGHI